MESQPSQDDRVQIETPEHVLFEYELAGLGSRMVAGLVDVMLMGFLLLGELLLVVAFTGLRSLGPWMIAAGAVAGFLTFWGYPIFFELRWRGQTPGKRSLHMRVIQEGGYSLTPQVVIVRNLLRIVDFLPGAYFLGLAVMMLNRRYKRVGDWVAGTLVVKERSADSKPPVAKRVAAPAGQEDKVAELRRQGVHRLESSHLQLILDFMERRHTLNPEARLRLADQLALSVSQKLEIPPERGERFLQCVLAAHARSEAEPEDGAPAPP